MKKESGKEAQTYAPGGSEATGRKLMGIESFNAIVTS